MCGRLNRRSRASGRGRGAAKASIRRATLLQATAMTPKHVRNTLLAGGPLQPQIEPVPTSSHGARCVFLFTTSGVGLCTPPGRQDVIQTAGDADRGRGGGTRCLVAIPFDAGGMSRATSGGFIAATARDVPQRSRLHHPLPARVQGQNTDTDRHGRPHSADSRQPLRFS